MHAVSCIVAKNIQKPTLSDQHHLHQGPWLTTKRRFDRCGLPHREAEFAQPPWHHKPSPDPDLSGKRGMNQQTAPGKSGVGELTNFTKVHTMPLEAQLKRRNENKRDSTQLQAGLQPLSCSLVKTHMQNPRLSKSSMCQICSIQVGLPLQILRAYFGVAHILRMCM